LFRAPFSASFASFSYLNTLRAGAATVRFVLGFVHSFVVCCPFRLWSLNKLWAAWGFVSFPIVKIKIVITVISRQEFCKMVVQKVRDTVCKNWAMCARRFRFLAES